MAVSPTGVLSKPIDLLEDLIAESATFQTWVGAASAAAAKTSIHLLQLPDPADSDGYSLVESQGKRPFCLLGFPVGAPNRFNRIADGATLTFAERGTLLMAFENNIEPIEDPDTLDDRLFTFLNNIGGIFADILAKAGTSDGSKAFLWVSAVEIIEFFRADRDELSTHGDYFWLSASVDWGFA